MPITTNHLMPLGWFWRHSRRLTGLLVFGLSVCLLLWTLCDRHTVVGILRQHIPTEDPQIQLLEVQLPVVPPRFVAINTTQIMDLPNGAWLIARGNPYPVANTNVVIADGVHCLRLPSPTPWLTRANSVFPLSNVHLSVSVAGGLLVLFCGLPLIRLSAGVLGAFVGGFCAWNITAYLALVGSMEVSDSAILMVTILGALATAILGARRQGIIAFLLQRLSIVAVLLLTLPVLGEQLSWPMQWIVPLAILGSVIKPALSPSRRSSLRWSLRWMRKWSRRTALGKCWKRIAGPSSWLVNSIARSTPRCSRACSRRNSRSAQRWIMARCSGVVWPCAR